MFSGTLKKTTLLAAAVLIFGTQPAPAQLLSYRNKAALQDAAGDKALKNADGDKGDKGPRYDAMDPGKKDAPDKEKDQIQGGQVIPLYGYDPHFVYNPYPWKVPAMYSAFRHYHLPPPLDPGEPPFGSESILADAGPHFGPEEAPAIGPGVIPLDAGLLPGFGAEAAPGTAVIRVKVPPEAEVWVFGTPTEQRGSDRRFVTPVLEVGQDLGYEFKARWQEGGKMVEQTRRIMVQPGARATVDFFSPDAGIEEPPLEEGPAPRAVP